MMVLSVKVGILWGPIRGKISDPVRLKASRTKGLPSFGLSAKMTLAFDVHGARYNLLSA